MRDRARLMGTALALCTALIVTTAVTSAEAYSCSVQKLRVTTRTLNVDGADVVDSGSSIRFYFGDATSWFTYYYLNNGSIEDFRKGAIDEFTKTFAVPYPDFPDHFQRLRIENRANPVDSWGMAGFKVEIMCSGSTEWQVIYLNRGVNTTLYYNSAPQPQYYHTAVGDAGSDSYDGDHEVFWLTNVGDHDGDADPDDLSSCNHDAPDDVRCQVRAVLFDSSTPPVPLLDEQLTESWWDVDGNTGGDNFVNPLEETAAEEGENNFWRWFWTSDTFTHSDVNEARLVLDSCLDSASHGECTMQTNYLHATVMQAWGYQDGFLAPTFRAHVYEADFTTAEASGWLHVATGGSDSVVTSNERLKTFYGTSGHAESEQDSEHTRNQHVHACGYMSADMILSTRGFSYESIPNTVPFDEADTWEEASALAHLVWGYKTMCCGSWNCCSNIESCVSNLTGNPVCSSSNYAQWWTWSRCNLAPGSGQWCVDNDDYFWRDQSGNGIYSEDERYPVFIDYNGVIHWVSQGIIGFDDDGDGTTDEVAENGFWNLIGGANYQILGKFLVDRVLSPTTEWSNYNLEPCGINPLEAHWFGTTTSVVDALDVGWGMFFGWSGDIGVCDSGHYSVIDGYEKIYHPNPPPGGLTWDYLFFISNTYAAGVDTGAEFDLESMDNHGFTRGDFQATVKGVVIWNYDFYK